MSDNAPSSSDTGDPTMQFHVTTAEPIYHDDSEAYYPTVRLSLEPNAVRRKGGWIMNDDHHDDDHGHDRAQDDEDDDSSHLCDAFDPNNAMMISMTRKRTCTTDTGSSLGGESEHEQFSHSEVGSAAGSSRRLRLGSLEEVAVDDDHLHPVFHNDDQGHASHHSMGPEEADNDNEEREQQSEEELVAPPQYNHPSIGTLYQDLPAHACSPQVVIASIIADTTTATATSDDNPNEISPRSRTATHENQLDQSINHPPNMSNNNDMDQNIADIEVVAVAQPIHFPGIDDSFRSDLELGDLCEPLDQPYSYYVEQHRLRQHHRQHSISGSSNTGYPLPSLSEAPRAEYMSATVLKQQTTERLGVRLCQNSMVLERIDRSDASLLRNCPFRPGDHVLSINHKRTESMDSPATAARMLRETTGYITLVAHNPRLQGLRVDGTDPCLVEAMITKAHKNQRSGMGLKSSGTRDLRISSINENGLFAHSILNVGDRIISINGTDVSELDARVACDIIKNAPQHVTILARTRHTTGVVVAEVSTRGMMESLATALPLLQGRSRRSDIEAWDDTLLRDKRKREQFILFLGMVIVMGVIFSSVFGVTAATRGEGVPRTVAADAFDASANSTFATNITSSNSTDDHMAYTNATDVQNSGS